MPKSGSMQVGPPLVGFEDDIAVCVVRGTIDGTQAEVLNAAVNSLGRQHGYILSLVDATQATGMTPEARRVGARYRREHPVPTANALFGVSLIVRAGHHPVSRPGYAGR